MKALVTGASGLVGGHVVRELLAQGHAVRALVRPTSDRRYLADLAVELVDGDVLAPDTLARAVRGCDVVFHGVAIFAYWGHAPGELDRVARDGTRHVLQAAAAAKVRRVVLTSSSVVLGASDRPDVRDESAGLAADKGVAYVAAKQRQLEVARTTARELGLDLVAVLPTITVGPYDARLGESNAILVNYLKDPYRTTWLGGVNVVAAEDVARGHLIAAERGEPGEIYLLGSENATWRDVHRTISELCGIPGPFVTANHTASYLAGSLHELIALVTGHRPPTSRAQARMVGRYYWYDHARAARLGYRPRPLREALAGALAWLVRSPHVTASIYQQLHLSDEVQRAGR